MAEEIQQTGSEIRGNSTAAPQSNTQPPRAMGFADLVMFYVVTGISLRWIATAAAAGPSSIVIWIGVWLCFYLPLALSVLELSSRYPQEGGLYVWSKRAFGDFSGFMSGWTYWTSNLPYFPFISPQATCCLCAAATGRIFPAARATTFGFRFSRWWPSPR